MSKHFPFRTLSLPTHLAIMTGVARPYDTVSISMICVRLYLRIYSVVIMLLLLLRLLHLRWMIAGIQSSAVAGDDAYLLIVLVGTSRAVFSCAF
jgi:hypothetical protein